MNHEPSDEVINRTIAEFMGDKKGKYLTLSTGAISEYEMKYTASLDALIPVIEKFEIIDINITFDGELWEADINTSPGLYSCDEADSPSKALALACYHAIKDSNRAPS